MGNVILYDTCVTENDRIYGQSPTHMASSNAWTKKDGWVQVPYGTTDWNFKGSALIQNGDACMFLHDWDAESPYFYGMFKDGGYKNSPYSQAGEWYGIKNPGNIWDRHDMGLEVIENSSSKVTVKYIGRHWDPVSYPGINENYFTMEKNTAWVRRQGIGLGSLFTFSCHARAGNGVIIAPPNDSINGTDMVYDPTNIDGPDYITYVIPSTHNKMVMQSLKTWDHNQPYIICRGSLDSGKITGKIDTKNTSSTTGTVETIGGQDIPPSNSVYLGQINFPNTIKIDRTAMQISKNARYTVGSSLPVQGHWRLTVRIDGTYYSFNVSNSNLSFIAPVTGTLEAKFWYLFDRTSNTPSNVYTPMDMVRAALDDTTPPATPTPPTPHSKFIVTVQSIPTNAIINIT